MCIIKVFLSFIPQCDASEGTWQMIKSVLDTSSYNETKIIAFLGGSCSLVTEPTAALSGRLYKVVQVRNMPPVVAFFPVRSNK